MIKVSDLKQFFQFFEDSDAVNFFSLSQYYLQKIEKKLSQVDFKPYSVTTPYSYGSSSPVSGVSHSWEFTAIIPFSELGITESPNSQFLKKIMFAYVKQFSSILNSSEFTFDGRYISRSSMYSGWISINFSYLNKILNFLDKYDSNVKHSIYTSFEGFDVTFVCFEKDSVPDSLIFLVSVNLKSNVLLRTLNTFDSMTQFSGDGKLIFDTYFEEVMKITDRIVKAVRLSSLS